MRINEAESGSGSMAGGESGICAGADAEGVVGAREEEVEGEGECEVRWRGFEEEEEGCGWWEEVFKWGRDEDGEEEDMVFGILGEGIEKGSGEETG